MFLESRFNARLHTLYVFSALQNIKELCQDVYSLVFQRQVSSFSKSKAQSQQNSLQFLFIT